MTQALNFFVHPGRLSLMMPALRLIFTEDFEGGTLGDYSIYLSSAQTVVDLTAVAPIECSLSCRIARASGASVTRANVTDGPGGSPQLTGRLRVRGARTESSSNSHAYGLVCMQSAEDLTAGGSAYGLRWRGDELDLVKTTSGTAGFSVLATVAITQGTGVNAIQLDWIGNQQGMLGGTSLAGWYGTASDFSDLTQVLAYVDSVSPLTTTAGQGFFGGDFGNGNDFRYVFDTLSLYGA